MKQRVLLWITVLALASCPVWAGAAKEQPTDTPEATGEATPEPTATPKPAGEKEIRAAFEAYLKEGRGIGANVLKKSEFQLHYDEGQEVWHCTVLPNRELMTTLEKEWMKAYEGSPGIRWDRLSALYGKDGARLEDAALAAYENMAWPVEGLIAEEKAIELARVVTGMQFNLKEKKLEALAATPLLRAPKGDEDAAHYEFHIEFREEKANDQGGIPWSYLAKVDAQNGQVLVVLENGDPNVDYEMGK